MLLKLQFQFHRHYSYFRKDFQMLLAVNIKDVNECLNIRMFVFRSNIRIPFLNSNIHIFYLSLRCASSKFSNEELLTCLERWLIKADNLPSDCMMWSVF